MLYSSFICFWCRANIQLFNYYQYKYDISLILFGYSIYITIFDAMKQKDTKETKFLLRIDPELKEKAEQVAKQDNRSLNGHIVSLVKKDITERTTNTQ